MTKQQRLQELRDSATDEALMLNHRLFVLNVLSLLEALVHDVDCLNELLSARG